MTSRRSVIPWLVWIAGSLAYAVAVMNRASLSALGPAAQEHFSIDATTLSAFAMLQLFVYAGCQIPVGLLLDRFGSSVMIISGGILMIVGQIGMATAGEVWIAIAARMLVGAGDACIFISVIRLIPEWFSVRQIPVLSQLTSMFGYIGQLVSVTPLALLVAGAGWATGFISVAATCFLVTLLAAVSLRDSPGTGTLFERVRGRLGRASREATAFGKADSTGVIAAMAPPPTGLIRVIDPNAEVKRRFPGHGFFTSARQLLSIPGVRLAYWVHFASPFSATVFLLLWGTPFLVGGFGMSMPAAQLLLSLTVVSSMLAGVLLGPLTSRFPEKRVKFVLAVVFIIVAMWLAVLLWPGTPPTWFIFLFVILMPLGGPASMIAFEVVRSHTPRSLVGFSTGIVNTAGFTSALSVILLVGLILDMQGAGSPENYSLEAFRWAFASQIPFWVLGATMIMVEFRKTKRWMTEHGRTLR